MAATDAPIEYRAITRTDALSLKGHRHAAHAMLHSPLSEERKLFGYYPVRHAVMLQMRFDGVIGFPGGYVERGESFEDGLRRELLEELGPDADFADLDERNHMASHVSSERSLCLHFYCKEIGMSTFRAIEKRLHEPSDHDLETLGIVRCPLYTMDDMHGGLPAFLRNNFIGNAREQLLLGLKHEKILSGEEVDIAMARSGMFRN